MKATLQPSRQYNFVERHAVLTKDALTPREDESPSPIMFELGRVRCVVRIDCTGHVECWTGHCWVRNAAHAKRYNPESAYRVASRLKAVVARFYQDKCGNYPLRRD